MAPHELTLSAASDALATRQLSVPELVDALITRADAVDGQIHAYLTRCDDQARQAAVQAQHALDHGRHLGPLHGIPYALKDIYDTAGLPTTGHSRHFAHRIPSRDSHVTRCLSQAGGILMGKLATHEMAHGGPSFDLPWPPARNPWRTDCFTGGSSSGSAAALAARLVPATVGSDTGGSIRGPASLCGITGLMPTLGLVGRSGALPNSYTLDRAGPMARTAEDCALLLQAMAGYDPDDPGSVRVAIPDYRAALQPSLAGLRIGLLRHQWEEATADAGIVHALETAADVLRTLGAQVETAHWLPLGLCHDVKTVLGETEILSVHQQALCRQARDFGEDFLQRVLPACLFSGADYLRASRWHARLADEGERLFGHYDVLLTMAHGAAPPLAQHQPLNFWRRPNPYTPANLSGHPALVVCNGYVDGLPLGMQLIGRRFGEATLLRVGHAYQLATDWHRLVPPLTPGQPPLPIVPTPQTTAEHALPADDLVDACDRAAAHAGLALDDPQRVLIYRAAPYARAMCERLAADLPLAQGPVGQWRLAP